MPFPAELRSLLRLNDGATQFLRGEFRLAAGFLPGGHRLLSARQVVEHRKMLDDILRGMDQDMVGWWWHPDWIPFAWGPSLTAVIDDIAQSVETGTPFRYFAPRVIDGRLDWNIIVDPPGESGLTPDRP